MDSRALVTLRSIRDHLQLPLGAKIEYYRDLSGLRLDDPGIDRAVHEGMAWLARAQDCSASKDGGVARHFSLIDGWSSSYPETTGYIVPTFFEYARLYRVSESLVRAQQMLNWLSGIQFSNGAFQGGCVDQTPVAPVAFNTGQVLLGLAAGTKHFGSYRRTMCKAADWLADTQDPDGCWRRFSSPFTDTECNTYDTHIAWGLLEASQLECCLQDSGQPLTHTIGYFLRGLLEGFRYSNDSDLLDAADRAADALLRELRDDGHLPGRFLSNWRPAVQWACLTGTAQIAHCWLMLYQFTGRVRYRDGGFLANQFVRRTIALDGPEQTRGAVKGSFPVDGDYGRYQYLSWAVKFCIDSNMLEMQIREDWT
jgi:hypothetical protein